jgi:DNA-directed RNA polymerase specialized sigma24 family protein
LRAGKAFPLKGSGSFQEKSHCFCAYDESRDHCQSSGGRREVLRSTLCQAQAAHFFLCLRMTGNHAQAEDSTQEAFLQVYRKIGSFREESVFSTWLHRLSVKHRVDELSQERHCGGFTGTKPWNRSQRRDHPEM